MSNPFDRNPWRLPPPWNPGYALPQNVDDEGLERHAYTTAWAPRGSYDDPKVGDAGYAVPEYVKEEGYGQGAFTTRWAERGTYAGPKVKHWLDVRSAKIVGAERLPGGAAKLQIQTMAGVEQAIGNERAPLATYGLDVADALIDTVKMMPPGLRKKQLKMALDKIDPKLYSRAEDDANKESKLGVPPEIALKRGLGAAVSYGLASELVAVAKRGDKMVPKKSQLGNAACFLGALPVSFPMIYATAIPYAPPTAPVAFPMILATVVPYAPPPDPTAAFADGTCVPERPGFIWRAATPTVAGHWERMRAGEQCGSMAPAGTVSVTVRDQRDGSSSGGGVTVTDSSGNVVKTTVRPPPTPPPAPVDQIFLNIGPFMIPATAGAWRDHRALTAEKKAYVDENIAIAAKAGGVSISEMKTGKYPFVKFKIKEGTEAWGLYYQEMSDGGTIVAYHKMPADQALQGLGGIIGDIGGAIKDVASAVGGAIWSVLKKIWAGIKWVAVKVANFVVDAAKWVAKMTCKITTTPGVAETAQAVATAAPNPYTVGIAAGITVTKMICDHYADKGGTAEEQAAAAAAAEAAAAAAAAAEEEARKKKRNLLLLAGAGLGVVLLLGGKKKK